MKYLVGFNGSDESMAALKLAIDNAKITKAKIYVITSMEGGPGEKMETIAQAGLDLNHARELLEKSDVPSEVHEMVRGYSPGEDLVLFAREHDIDQIFVGIEKKSRTRKILLGSTAQYIILKAGCPVTTVKKY